ncbi:TPA: helix-turn-helix transcriptional regulator [Pseudomonas aeruginosa]
MDIMDDRLIKATEVCQLIGRGKTTLYNLIRSGAFPPPKKMVRQGKPGSTSLKDRFLRG